MGLRILHISTRLIQGGSQENTVLSCEGQTLRGDEAHLAFGPIYGPEGTLLPRVEAFNERARAAGTPEPIGVHEVADLIRAVHPLRDARCLKQLKALIADLRPDVVHTHSSKAGVLGRWAAWESTPRPAVVHTIHGPPFMPVEGSPLARAKTRLKNHIYTVAERFAAARCHQIVSVADAMTRTFLERGIGRPEQYLTVRSGMETEVFLEPKPGEDRASMRARLGFSDHDFVVGTVARLAEHKGHDDLLDGLAPAMAHDPNIKLLWVGDGWWRDRLLARVRALGLENRVITTGLVPMDAVAAHIRAMDVLAHPSSREGLPRTVPQALLCSVCPVCYNVDGGPEVCIDGQTGLVTPLGDGEALARAVLRLRDDPQLRTRMAEQGRTMCAEMFSTERMVEELARVYERALEMAGR